MQDAAVTGTDLTIIRKGITALDHISFSIPKGKITGLIGPSGSGKTTLMRSIIGSQRITSGDLTVLGKPAGNAGLRKKIGYVSQDAAVYGDLTVGQNLEYFSAILDCGPEQVQNVLEMVDLTGQARQMVGTLSGGQRARVSLAVALLDDAELLILDEPTVGLDPLLRKHLWDLFAQLALSGQTLLISSHDMDEAERCPELLLLREGRILRHSSKQELLKDTGATTVHQAFLNLVEEPAYAS